MANGIARNEASILAFLEGCESVHSINASENMIRFQYDPEKIPQNPPEGVFFNLSDEAAF